MLKLKTEIRNADWKLTFNDGEFTATVSHEAFLGLVHQLVACALYAVPTECVCDVKDERGETE